MENMKFYGLLDFYPKKEYLKARYELLTIEEIIQYKMYVYSLPWTDDDVKDLIWEYFNDWSIEVLSKLGIKYRKKKEINDKRQQKYKNEAQNEMQYVK